MAALGPVELELLDLLCCAAYFRCRVTKVKPGPAAALQRLRWAGLVQLDGYEPSPWAFHDWLERQDGERLVHRIQETAAPLLRIPEPENPPKPTAGEGGGGADARVEAPSPIPWPSATEISDEILAFCKLHGIAKSRLSWFLFRSPSAVDRMRGRKAISFEIVAECAPSWPIRISRR
jgi:hypothetical protein